MDFEGWRSLVSLICLKEPSANIIRELEEWKLENNEEILDMWALAPKLIIQDGLVSHMCKINYIG